MKETESEFKKRITDAARKNYVLCRSVIKGAVRKKWFWDLVSDRVIIYKQNKTSADSRELFLGGCDRPTHREHYFMRGPMHPENRAETIAREKESADRDVYFKRVMASPIHSRFYDLRMKIVAIGREMRTELTEVAERYRAKQMDVIDEMQREMEKLHPLPELPEEGE